jgi:ABC-type Fe3+/spermidine/putrescine transport system ATPase subunit
VLRAPLPDDARVGEQFDLVIRPENIRLSVTADGADVFRAEVTEATFLGNLNDYRVGHEDLSLRVQAHPNQIFEVGETVFVGVDSAGCVVVRS